MIDMHQHKVHLADFATALFVAVLALSAWPASGLEKPVDLGARPGDASVTLSWRSVNGASAYQYRQREAEAVNYNAWAATAIATSTSHTVKHLRNGTAYSFQVRAVRGAIHGPVSDTVTETPFAPCGGESANRNLAADCEALLLARAKLDPGGTLNWSRSRALSEWTGVVVSAGRVTRLRCPAGGLANGQLDEPLGRLTGLIALELGDCGLAGVIPNSLGSLRSLEVFAAYGNRLSGPIPIELANLTRLKTLSLSYNKLNGTIPNWLGSLVNLERLHLGVNAFTGAIPSGIGNLVKLKVLNISYLDLTPGAIPRWLRRLTALETLYLADSNRTGTVPT